MHAVFLRTHPPVTSTDCPAKSNGGGGHSPARRPGSDRRLRPRSCSPVAPFGGLRPFGCATARCVNQSSTGGDWVPASTGDGIGGRLVVALPPLCPHRRSDSDHVLWRNRESRSRPGNCVSRPGNAISWELSPLMNIVFIIFLFCEFLMVFAGSALLSHYKHTCTHCAWLPSARACWQ